MLVKEACGLWSLPGGWVDANQTVASNVVEKAYEEAGHDVRPVRLLALLDRNINNTPPFLYNLFKAFVLCEVTGGEFKANHETVDYVCFSLLTHFHSMPGQMYTL